MSLYIEEDGTKASREVLRERCQAAIVTARNVNDGELLILAEGCLDLLGRVNDLERACKDSRYAIWHGNVAEGGVMTQIAEALARVGYPLSRRRDDALPGMDGGA